MLKCLMKYEWVKLRRNTLPVGTEQRIVAVLAWVLHSEMQPFFDFDGSAALIYDKSQHSRRIAGFMPE